MKKAFIVFIVQLLFSLDLFAQYYIGQEKIDEAAKNRIGYGVGMEYEIKDNKVYLENVSFNGHVSDVLIGFDKSSYLRGETVVLTFKRSNKNSSVECEHIQISNVPNVSAEGFKLTKTRDGISSFDLKAGEVKKITIGLWNKNQVIDRIWITIGEMIYSNEHRSYVIPYTPFPKPVKKEDYQRQDHNYFKNKKDSGLLFK